MNNTDHHRLVEYIVTDQARMLRLVAGITTEKAAKQLGVNRTSIHKWESGEVLPHPGNKARYLAWLDDLSAKHGDVEVAKSGGK